MLIVDILAPVYSTLREMGIWQTTHKRRKAIHSSLFLFDEQITSRVVCSHILRAAEISAYSYTAQTINQWLFCCARCETQQQQPDNGKTFWSNKNKNLPDQKGLISVSHPASRFFFSFLYATTQYLLFSFLSRIHTWLIAYRMRRLPAVFFCFFGSSALYGSLSMNRNEQLRISFADRRLSFRSHPARLVIQALFPHVIACGELWCLSHNFFLIPFSVKKGQISLRMHRDYKLAINVSFFPPLCSFKAFRWHIRLQW